MIEYNAAGTRVTTRPLWVLALLMLTGPIYRIYWMYRTNSDLAEFGRARPESPGQRVIETSAGATAVWMALAIPGVALFTLFAMPWGNSFAPESIGGTDMPLGVHIGYAVFGLALTVPAFLSLLRTRGRIRAARELGGLPRDTRWSGGWFVVSMLFEIFGVPVWLFSAQHALNDLWSRYPLLLDEDLHGEFAPEPARASALGARPALHEARLQRIAYELEQPRARPYVAIAFFVLNVIVFSWQVTQHGFFPDSTADLEHVGAYSPEFDGGWWRFWTANVLHANVAHIVGNMTIWLFVAIIAERIIGSARMLLLIIAGAAGTSIGTLINGSAEPTLGASGVVFACFGMALMLDPRARRPIGRFGWILSITGIAFSTFVPGTASYGHVGGIIAGLAVGGFIMVFWKPDRTAEPAVIGWPAPDALDRSAPLAAHRELPVEARLQHLIARRNANELSDLEFERLRTALLTRG